MWDFKLGEAISLNLKTAPFIVLKLLIYFGITLGYVIGTGAGAGIGYAVTHFGDDPGSGAGLGGLIGFAVVSGVLYWLREYILYLVKAGHIAVLVELMDGNRIPGGRSQIDHAQKQVRSRFAQASILFAMDQLVKGVLRAINRTTVAISAFIPIPGLSGLVDFANKIIAMSLTYVDEIILAYNLKNPREDVWAGSRTAIVLYAQNYKTFLKNAVFLTFIMYGLAIVGFVLFLGPAALIASMFPDSVVGVWSVVIALLMAFILKAALLEPIAMTALMQVYFKVIEGQTPNPEWDEKLSSMSKKFRKLKDRAAEAVRPPPVAES